MRPVFKRPEPRKSQRQQELEAADYFAGPRDPKRNRAFRGRFMVCEREALTTQPPSAVQIIERFGIKERKPRTLKG